MKQNLAVLACLLYGSQAINLQNNEELVSIGERMRDIDERQFVSIGQKMQERGLVMIDDTEEKRDSDTARSLFGSVDFESYN